MLKFNFVDWVENVQPKILKAGYCVIPGCKRAAIMHNEIKEMQVEFETEKDEIFFILRFV